MIRVERADGARLGQYADQALNVYAAAMGRPAAELPARRLILRRHLTYPGIAARLALDPGGRLVAFGYGYLGAPGQWWHDVVAPALERAPGGPWLEDVFDVAELHVLPDFQRAGLGRRLLTELLSAVPARRAVLSTPDANIRARSLYRSLGFGDLATGFRFPGIPESYCVLGRPLPLSAATAAGVTGNTPRGRRQ